MFICLDWNYISINILKWIIILIETILEKNFYAKADYSQEEIDVVIELLKNNRLSLICGDKVKELEKKIALLFNKNYILMVNSGKSANLIAFLSLNLPKGLKVITPDLTYSTTVSPILKYDLITYSIDVEE